MLLCVKLVNSFIFISFLIHLLKLLYIKALFCFIVMLMFLYRAKLMANVRSDNKKDPVITEVKIGLNMP